jgi:hypothetical protein
VTSIIITDATTLQFNKIFKKCNADKPFTYLVVAMGDTHSMANTIIELKQLLYKKGDKCINIPVVIRMKDNNTFLNTSTSQHNNTLLNTSTPHHLTPLSSGAAS